MNRKGFTLIELLAVIIILAVIALIATPVVLNVVDSAKKSAFESSAYGIVDTIRLDYQEGILSGNNVAKTYDFSTTTELDNKFSGEKPQGIAKVDADGRIEMAIHNGKWCALKKLNEGTVTITDYDETTCVLSTGSTDTTDGYQAGDYVEVQLASGVTANFYILSIDGNNVTAIMDRNYSDNVAWLDASIIYAKAEEQNIEKYSEAYYALIDKLAKELGPATANAALPTSEDWINASVIRLPKANELLEQTEWYQGLTDTSDWENEYVTYINTASQHESFGTALQTCGEESNKCYRAGFVAYEKATGLDSILLPEWLDVNLNTSGDDLTYGYWTSNSLSNNTNADFDAWSGSCFGAINFKNVEIADKNGVRPVIEIDKSYIIEDLSDYIFSYQMIDEIHFNTEYNLDNYLAAQEYNSEASKWIATVGDYYIVTVDLSVMTSGAYNGYAVVYVSSDYSSGQVIYSTTTFDLTSSYSWAKAETTGWNVDKLEFEATRVELSEGVLEIKDEIMSKVEFK